MVRPPSARISTSAAKPSACATLASSNWMPEPGLAEQHAHQQVDQQAGQPDARPRAARRGSPRAARPRLPAGRCPSGARRSSRSPRRRQGAGAHPSVAGREGREHASGRPRRGMDKDGRDRGGLSPLGSQSPVRRGRHAVEVPGANGRRRPDGGQSGGSPRQPRTALSTRVTRSWSATQPGDEADGVVALRAPPAEAAAGAAHPEAVVVERRPRDPSVACSPEHVVQAGHRRPPPIIARERLRESSRPSAQRDEEPGHRASRAVPVDRRRPRRGRQRRGVHDRRGRARRAGCASARRITGRPPRPACGTATSKPVRSATRGEVRVAQPDVEVEAVRRRRPPRAGTCRASGRRRGGRPRRPGGRRAAPTRRTPWPGSHSGGCAAISAAHQVPVVEAPPSGAGLLQAARCPDWWLSTWPQRRRARPAPASTSSAARRGRARPRSTSTSAHTAANGLVTRVGHHQGVLDPRPGAGRVGVAAPQVDHPVARRATPRPRRRSRRRLVLVAAPRANASRTGAKSCGRALRRCTRPGSTSVTEVSPDAS